MKDKGLDTWYASWFDTPYYHILYKNRNHEEAELFMDNLCNYLELESHVEILDLACGKGRHSIYLNSLGYRVTGLDLSKKSISYAKQFENNRLRFAVHNMTQIYPNTFDAVFNLFTSFGYFENINDNIKTLQAIKNQMNLKGVAIIDFLNKDFVLNNLVPQEKKTMEGITFHIKRFLKDSFITKTIQFTDKQKEYSFIEKVSAFGLSDFENFCKKAQLQILNTFGDYNLSPFDSKTSKRLILVLTHA